MFYHVYVDLSASSPLQRLRDTLKGDTKKTELEKDEGGVRVDDNICSVILGYPTI